MSAEIPPLELQARQIRQEIERARAQLRELLASEATASPRAADLREAADLLTWAMELLERRSRP